MIGATGSAAITAIRCGIIRCRIIMCGAIRTSPRPSPRVYAATGDDPNLSIPSARCWNDLMSRKPANHVTSGCGLGLYRDDLLRRGLLRQFVHLRAGGQHSLSVATQGKQGWRSRHRSARAGRSRIWIFLSSRDNWFRPVQAKTGPDGALYVVDMYRFVIEHPRWISKERLAQLDVRAGADMGRIYRVYPADKKLRPVPNLKKFSTSQTGRSTGHAERNRTRSDSYRVGSAW